MKKYIVLPLIGVAALLSSCVVDPYGPGAAYGPYGEPYFVYGGMNYYSYGGRYYYVEHGHRVYVHQLPSGGHYYRSQGIHNGHNYSNGPGYPRTMSTHNNGYNNQYTNKANFNNTKFTGTNHGNQLGTMRGTTGTPTFKGGTGTPAIKSSQSAPAKGSKDKH